MRALMLLLTALLVAPAASAMLVMEDADGDATASLQGQALPADRAGIADLVSLDVAEDDTGFLFTLVHGAAPDPGIYDAEATEYRIHFRHNDAWFEAVPEIWYPLVTPSPVYWVSLYTADEDGKVVGGLPDPEMVSADPTTFVFHVPRERLADSQGVAPEAGRYLEDFHAWTRTGGAIGFTVNGERVDDEGPQYRDAMPDDGVSPVRYAATHGLYQTGLHLSSPEALRWSNGEATAFAYKVQVMDEAGEDQAVVFTAEDVPSGWTVVVPDPFFLDAGTDRTVDVIVHVPFRHQHGDTTTFRLKATSGDAASLGQIDLGVLYPAIPQPTGHHDTLYLHSHEAYDDPVREALFAAIGAPDRYRSTMNTLQSDPDDGLFAVPGRKVGLEIDEGPRIVYGWRVPLSPGLRMGIDLDTASLGAIAVDLKSTVDMLDVELAGRVWVGPPRLDNGMADTQYRNGTTLAWLRSEPVAAGSAATLTATVEPTQDGDRVAFDPDQQLYMDLLAYSTRPESILTPAIGIDLMGGSLRLPLEEYHDSIVVPITAAQQKLIEETAPEAVVPVDEAHGSPGVGLLPLLGVFVLAARRPSRRAGRGLLVVALVAALGLAGCADPVDDARVDAAPEQAPQADPATWPIPQWAPVDEATLRPGVRILGASPLPDTGLATTDTLCTSNFLYTDADGTAYLGTAGHCFAQPSDCTVDPTEFPLGSEVAIEGAEHPGILRYDSFYAMVEAGETAADLCDGNDLALIELDPADVAHANPTVLGIGGPHGLARAAPEAGDVSYTYGSTDFRPGPHELDARQGVYVTDGSGGWTYYYYYDVPGVPGDSGSAVVDADGDALGVFVTLSIAPLAGANGVAVLSSLLEYAAAAGLAVQVATV